MISCIVLRFATHDSWVVSLFRRESLTLSGIHIGRSMLTWHEADLLDSFEKHAWEAVGVAA
jgi:hypothetical protein